MQDQVAHAGRKAARVGDREGRAAQPREHREAIQPQGFDHGAHVRDHRVDRMVDDAAIGKAESARIEAHQRMAARKLGKPVAEHRARQVELEVAMAAGQHDQRRAAPDHGVRDPHPVGGLAEADALADGAHGEIL